ncbi:unnamed protein product [Closterium sp. NIES-54]
MLRSGVAIFDLDYDAILAAMYALSVSAEGECYLCVPPDPGIEAVALGASESALPSTAPAEAFHTFTLDSGASRCFFRDSTTLTRSSSVLPCPVVPSGSLSGLHLPSFSTILVSTAALQDAMITTTTPGGQTVSICKCTRTGRHLATFTRRPGSSLYTLATEHPRVVASVQVPASGPVAPPCSCRLLTHQNLLWHHLLGHPSLPRLRGMLSRLLVSGLPRSLPPLPPLPAPLCLPCVEGQQRAAPHSSSFPPTTAPLQTLHMDVWGPVRVSGQGRECYFLLDLPVLRLHSDRGGEFSSDILPEFFRGERILQSFTLPASPEQNGIAERRIGLVVETLPTLRWTGKVGDASVFWVYCSRAFVCDTSADKLCARAIPCVFPGFPPDVSGWQFYHPTSRRVLPSQDVTFDELVPFYCLFPYRSAPPPPLALFLAPGPPPVDPLPPQSPAPSGVSHVDPLPCIVPVEVAVDSGAARGATYGGVASGGAELGLGGAEPGGAEHGVVEPAGVELGGAEPVGVEPGGAESEGAESRGAEPRGTASSGDFATGDTGAGGVGATRLGGVGVTAGACGTGGVAAAAPGGARTRGTGAAGTGSVRGVGAGGAGAGDPVELGGAGAGGARTGGTGARGAGAGGARAGDTGAIDTRAVDPGAGGARAGGAVSGGTGAGGTVRSRPFFVPLLRQVLSLPSSTGLPPSLLSPPPCPSQPQLQPGSKLPAPSPYAKQTDSLTERCEPESRPASHVCAVCPGRRVPRPRPPPVPGTHAMALCPSSCQRVRLGVHFVHPRAGGCQRSTVHPRLILGKGYRHVGLGGYGRTDPLLNKPFYPNGAFTWGWSSDWDSDTSVPLRVPLPPPPESSLPAILDPESDLARAACPTVSRLLATVVIDPSFESTTASALVAELVDFAAVCHLDYPTALVAESESASPLSVGGECALGTDVLEDRYEEFECLAAAVPRGPSPLAPAARRP